jgi:hypothetical protein
VVSLTVGMLRIKRTEPSIYPHGSCQMVFALEGADGFVANYDGFESMSTDLRRRFIFKHEDLKVARFVLQGSSQRAFELDAARIN